MTGADLAMSAAIYLSAAIQSAALHAAWLASHHRPCACGGDGPLDLREERGRIVCAECSRPWMRREVTP